MLTPPPRRRASPRRPAYLRAAARTALALAIAAAGAGACRSPRRAPPEATPPTTIKGEVVTFPSGKLTLHGVVHRPPGAGPFPAVLYNHGSSPGMLPVSAADALGPVFAARGWLFFMPFRRGQALSAEAGPYIMDEIQAARRSGGMDAASTTMVRLLSTDHLDDQLAALAWLRGSGLADPRRIAVAGNSFGGIETVLGAERGAYCAAVDSAGGAMSWAHAPPLHDLMLASVRRARVPIFFFQAENDFDLAPSRVLSAAMKEVGKPYQMKIYPPFGSSAQQGHGFGYFGSAVWADDIFRFLDASCAASGAPAAAGGSAG
jgi:dienelactone hydrolase